MLQPPELGESFPSVERLNIWFKRRIAKARGKEAEDVIRQEWDQAKARFWDEHPAMKPGPPMSDAEARELAREQYGDPAAAGTGTMGATNGVPTPIKITWPRVEVEESK